MKEKIKEAITMTVIVLYGGVSVWGLVNSTLMMKDLYREAYPERVKFTVEPKEVKTEVNEDAL